MPYRVTAACLWLFEFINNFLYEIGVEKKNSERAINITVCGVFCICTVSGIDN